ncbi:MAG: hypothetical protein KIT31_07300 [Deltaproteobacteria bacterium]|nr:hypothetical protein [Deltaproteobacteria bacterium]
MKHAPSGVVAVVAVVFAWVAACGASDVRSPVVPEPIAVPVPAFQPAAEACAVEGKTQVLDLEAFAPPVEALCSTSSDCGGFGRCSGGKCGTCSTSSDCNGHGTCSGGTCNHCSTSSDCKTGSCNGGKCGACSTSSDCRGNGNCSGGRCGACSTSSDCSVGNCSGGRCGACSTSSDCKGGTCSSGRCSNYTN